ncbi:MAG: hypothetical protein ACLRZ4_04255 [Eubacterium ramulus]|uniref:hypothetical protein n=1 Tax=Eubacterium ramulus TaxID=39490 RepID=UPI0039A2C96E
MNYYHVQDTEIMVHRNGMEKRIFRRGTAERAGESMEILRNRYKATAIPLALDAGLGS